MANVKTFGAVGDGITDDTTAIQAALNSGDSLVQFPTGTYLCNKTSRAPWPDWYPADRLFSLPNNLITVTGFNGPVSIITDKPAILFDGNANPVSLQWMTLKCRSGFTPAGYSFAILVRGNLSCYNVTFVDWTNAVKYLDAPSPSCQTLSFQGCIFRYEQGIADADPSFGYPNTAILGGGLATSIAGCAFDGDKAFWSKAADGLIKTNKQVSSLTVTGCDIRNYGEEAIACDGQNGLVIDIESTRFWPSPVIQGGQCSISLFGTVTGKIKV